MRLEEKINEKLKVAMKSKDKISWSLILTLDNTGKIKFLEISHQSGI